MTRYLTVLTLVLAAVGASAQQPLFELAGRSYAAQDLSPRMLQLYGRLIMEQRKQLDALIDEMVFDVYVEREAAREGRDVQAFGKALLAVPEPSEQTIRAFYDQHRTRIPQPYEQARPQILEHLKRIAARGRRDDLIAQIKREDGFKPLLAAPQPPTLAIDTAGRPYKGNPEAAVTVVEFSDFQCPHCARASVVMQRLVETYPQVKVVHMDFPINPSGISRRVAHGGVCAQSQGRFWEYHDLAYSRQSQLDEDSPLALARELELEISAFEACLAAPATAERVEASFRIARRLGLTATPSLFVDGKPFPSNHLLRDLGLYIERKRAASG